MANLYREEEKNCIKLKFSQENYILKIKILEMAVKDRTRRRLMCRIPDDEEEVIGFILKVVRRLGHLKQRQVI